MILEEASLIQCLLYHYASCVAGIFQMNGRAPSTSLPASRISNFCDLSNHINNSAKQGVQLIRKSWQSLFCLQSADRFIDSRLGSLPH